MTTGEMGAIPGIRELTMEEIEAVNGAGLLASMVTGAMAGAALGEGSVLLGAAMLVIAVVAVPAEVTAIALLAGAAAGAALGYAVAD